MNHRRRTSIIPWCALACALAAPIGAYAQSTTPPRPAPTPAPASKATPKRPPTDALRKKGGMAAALNGGGTAHVTDLSAVDLNPAGLALGKEISLGGEMHWIEDNTQYVEAGVLDSMMSEIAAGIKARMSSSNSGGKDRRFSMGLAERLGESPWVLGIGGDYMQIEGKDAEGKTKFRDNARLRAGVIFNLTETLLLGARTDGYLDKFSDKEHAVGISAVAAGFYLFNADAVFADSTFDRALAGVTVMAKEYLDLRVSYGYADKSSVHSGAAGIMVKSQQIRLYYNAAKPNLRHKEIEHTIGLALTVPM